MNDLRLLAALLSALALTACSDSEPTSQASATNPTQQTQAAGETPLERDLDRTAQATEELVDDAGQVLSGAVATTGDAIDEVVEGSEELAAEATDATGEGLEQAGEGLENLADEMGEPNTLVGTLAEATDATGKRLEQAGDLLEHRARQMEPELESSDLAALETKPTQTGSDQDTTATGQPRQAAPTLAQQGTTDPAAAQDTAATEGQNPQAAEDSGQGSEQADASQQDQQTSNASQETDGQVAEGNQQDQQTTDSDQAGEQQTAETDQQGSQEETQASGGPGTDVDPQTQEAISEIVQEAGETIEQLMKGEISPAEARARLGGDSQGTQDQRMSPYPAGATSADVEQTAREAIEQIMTTAREAIDQIARQTAGGAPDQAGQEEGLVEQTEAAAGQAAQAVGQAGEEAGEVAQDAAETTEETAEATGEAVSDAVETTEETAEDAAKATGEAVGDAVEATEETLGNAAQATEEVVEDAVEATGDALQEAEQVVEEAVEDTGEAIGEAARETGEALGITEPEQPDDQATIAEEAGEAIGGTQATGGDGTQANATGTSGQQGSDAEDRIQSLRDAGIPGEMVDNIEEQHRQAESSQPQGSPEQTVPESQMTDQDDAVPQVGEQGGTLDKPMGNTMDPAFRTQTPDTAGGNEPRVGPDGGGSLATDEGPGPYTENQPGGKFDDPAAEGRDGPNFPQNQPEGIVQVQGEDEPRPAGVSAQGETMGPATSGQETGEADSQQMPALNAMPADGQTGADQAQGGQAGATDNQRGPVGEADAYKQPVENAGTATEPDDASVSAEEADSRVEALIENATRPSGEPKPFDAARQEEQAGQN